MVRPGLYIAVGLGSAFGALLRFAFSLWLAVPGDLPLATMVVNVIGSFWIGYFVSLTAPEGRWQLTDWQKHFMLTGVCAGFTTFSMFSLEFLLLLQAGKLILAVGYMLLSLLLWLLACQAGLRFGACTKAITSSK